MSIYTGWEKPIIPSHDVTGKYIMDTTRPMRNENRTDSRAHASGGIILLVVVLVVVLVDGKKTYLSHRIIVKIHRVLLYVFSVAIAHQKFRETHDSAYFDGHDGFNCL